MCYLSFRECITQGCSPRPVHIPILASPGWSACAPGDPLVSGKWRGACSCCCYCCFWQRRWKRPPILSLSLSLPLSCSLHGHLELMRIDIYIYIFYIYIYIPYSYWQLGDFHEQILPPLHQKPCVGYLLWKKTWLFWFKKKQRKNPWDFPSGISDFVAKLQTWATQVEGAHVVMVNFGVHSGNDDIIILTILMCRYITLHLYIVIYIIFSLYLYIILIYIHTLVFHWYMSEESWAILG